MNLVQQLEHSTLGLATYKMESTVQKKEKLLESDRGIPNFGVDNYPIKLINRLFS